MISIVTGEAWEVVDCASLRTTISHGAEREPLKYWIKSRTDSEYFNDSFSLKTSNSPFEMQNMIIRPKSIFWFQCDYNNDRAKNTFRTRLHLPIIWGE